MRRPTLEDVLYPDPLAALMGWDAPAGQGPLPAPRPTRHVPAMRVRVLAHICAIPAEQPRAG